MVSCKAKDSADVVGWWMIIKNGQEGWAPSN
jgi:hypothetical protein